MHKKTEHLEDRNFVGLRQYSPTAARNKGPIADILAKTMRLPAQVLEIASGSGEQGLYICQSIDDVIWQYSDISEQAIASQNSWATESAVPINPSLYLDVCEERWWEGLGEFTAIYCSNMIHIAPWDAALGLAKGAGEILKTDGQIFLYGPFLEGIVTAESNFQFDAVLKSRNSAWGVRNLDDVKHIFADAGFNLTGRFVMPAENRMLIFTKA